MKAEGLDVAAFEFVTDSDGVAYVYDINTNTNYNSDAEGRAGISAMGRLAAYLGQELALMTGQKAASSTVKTACQADLITPMLNSDNPEGG